MNASVRQRLPVSGMALLLIVGLYFALPLFATGVFSFWEGGDRYGLSAYASLVRQSEMARTIANAKIAKRITAAMYQ